jgi:hypothetical protein
MKNEINDIREILIGNIFIYERKGYDKREMTFLRDGQIGYGRATMEDTWKLDIKDNTPILTITSANNESFEIQMDDNGTWYGKWPFHEKMEIIVTPKVLCNKEYESDFTILIQGPLNSISIDNICNYKNFGKIIVSCWDSDDITLLSKIKDNFTIIKNSYPLMSINNSANIAKQITTTLSGLKICDTEFCIKVRSDEYYSDLTAIVTKLKENPHKIISSTVCFCNRPYHPSDHIIAGKTKTLTEGFKCSLQMIKGLISNPIPISFTSERILCLGMIIGLNEIPTMHNWISLMKKYYDIVPMKELGDFLWRANIFGASSDKDNFNDYVDGLTKTIYSMDELGINPLIV